MAKYKSIVVTNAGLELIAAAQSGDTIEFTAMKTGAGVYDGTEVLSELTGLKDLKQTFGVTGITREGTVIKVRSVIDNMGLDTGYNITEIGLFAKDKSGNEILYAIVVAETGLEDYLPAYADAPTTITSEMYIDVSSVDSSVEFQATIIPGTYVTVQDFEDYKSQQNQYEDSFVASIEIKGKTITAKNKDGVVLFTGETYDTTYSLATTAAAGLMDSADKTKLNGVEAGAQKNTITGVKGNSESSYRTGNVNITKGNIGLGNVDNTSDADKPVSTAQQAALDLKVDTADYEANVLLLERQDTLNAQSAGYAQQAAQQVGMDLENHEMNYTNPHKVTKSQVGLGNVDNTSDADKPVSTAQQAALDLKVDKVSGKGLSTNDYTTNEKNKLGATNVAYGTCSTAAATAAKVISISGNTNWKLAAGSIIIVKFTNTNTAQNPTFNVNNTGAKSVWYNTAVLTTSSLGYAGTANRPMIFAYDGTQYVFMGWAIDSNTTYSNFVKSGSSAKAGLVPAPPSTAGTAKYLREDGTWAVPPDTTYTHPSYTARTGVPTANQTPAFGGTFSVSQPVSDATGHITAMTSRTVKIPNNVATKSANGLMSSADKTALAELIELLTTKTGSITWVSGYTPSTIEFSQIKQNGKNVKVLLGVAFNTAINLSSNVKIGTISGVSMPDATIREDSIASTEKAIYLATNSEVAVVTLTTDGSLYAATKSSSIKGLIIDISYIVD